MIARRKNIYSFLCPIAKYIWNVTSVVLGINSIQTSFGDLYRDWFNSNCGRGRRAVMLGSITVIWGMCGKQERNLVFKEYDLGS
jgi:hypothetical protein